MAASSLKLMFLFALLSLAARSGAATAFKHDAGAPLLLDAQSITIDLKTNSAVFGKIKISQGPMSITADEGKATQQKSADLYFDNNVWFFKGNVKTTLEQGQLTSDDAQITFVNKLLTKAVANGKPAAFVETESKNGKFAKGHSDTIDYDSSKHLVRFLKDAYLSNGDNDIRGESLKYDVLGQKVIADEAEQNSKRVHITITPPPKSKP